MIPQLFFTSTNKTTNSNSDNDIINNLKLRCEKLHAKQKLKPLATTMSTSSDTSKSKKKKQSRKKRKRRLKVKAKRKTKKKHRSGPPRASPKLLEKIRQKQAGAKVSCG